MARRRRFGSRLLVLVVLGLLVGLGLALTSRPMLRQFFPIYYGSLVVRTADRYSLDPYMVAAVIHVESRYDTHAVSSQGAVGLMQLMPETAEWIASKRGQGPGIRDKLAVPEVNITYGCWYLRSLLNEFHEDPVLALAAYNGGRGQVAEWLRSQKWTGTPETVDLIPFPETRLYVQRVLATYRWYHQLYPEFPRT